MIHNIKIKNLKNSKFKYLLNLGSDIADTLINTKEITFNKGLNVIIGENGCGKSTLINMLSTYTFCNDGESKIILGLYKDSISSLFTDSLGKNVKMLDGIIVNNDYRLKVIKLVLEDSRGTEDTLKNFLNFANFVNSRGLSEGQKLIYSIGNTINRLFSSDLRFDLSPLKDSVNDLWKKYQEDVKKYITNNQVNEIDPTYSLLMDEPDRNLDILNVNQILTILSNQKPNGQMIVSIHNPLLIYALSKQEGVNWIELSKGYLDSVIENVETIINV